MSPARAATFAGSGCASSPSSAVRTRDMPSTSGASGVHGTWSAGTGKSAPAACAMSAAWLSWSSACASVSSWTAPASATASVWAADGCCVQPAASAATASASASARGIRFGFTATSLQGSELVGDPDIHIAVHACARADRMFELGALAEARFHRGLRQELPLVADLGRAVVGAVVGRQQPAGVGAADRDPDVVLRREVVDAGQHLPGEAAGFAGTAGVGGAVQRRLERVADLGAGDEARAALAQRPLGGDARV